MYPTETEDNLARQRRRQWTIPDDVIYLNHGSFGPSPILVQEARHRWTVELEREPMDFFVRRMERHLCEAAEKLADFVGADANDLAFVDNATAGMNIVAASVSLKPDDEVLLTNHEYGAVMRIWRRACQASGAKLVVQALPEPLTSPEEVVDTLFRGVTDRTRLIVVSHVTSPTAVILPVEAICRRARERGVQLCVDGPHAVAMLPIDFRRLDCDWYCASGHKWLCGPFGSGFLRVARRRQQHVVPPVMSWGGSVSGKPARWQDELNWIGTRDPAPFLAIPAAIDFMRSNGLDLFRRRAHELCRQAAEGIARVTGCLPFVPVDSEWYGSMVTCPLPDSVEGPPPPGRRDALQNALWEQYRIEAPVVHWHGRRFLRVSCHLYTTSAELDRLVEAIEGLI